MPARKPRTRSVRTKQRRLSRAEIAAFVDRFGSKLGRRERREACVDYLHQLLRHRGKRGSDSPAGKSDQPDVLRNFVNRSPWSHEAVMQRLRQIAVEQKTPDSVLGLREIRVPKIGFGSVGCERSPGERSPTSQSRRGHQTIIAWFWITENHASLIAAQLYLPHRWCLDAKYADENLVPEDQRRYRSKGDIALELLNEIRTTLPGAPSIVVDMAFSEMWACLSSLFEYSGQIMVRLDPLGQWPWTSDFLGEVEEPGDRDLYASFMHGKAGGVRIAEMVQRQKTDSGGGAVVNLAEAGRAARRLLNRPRYLFVMPQEAGDSAAYLLNRAKPAGELVALSEKLEAMHGCAERVLPVLLRFHGRTWRGLHHHLCLAAMADMIAVNHFDPSLIASPARPRF